MFLTTTAVKLDNALFFSSFYKGEQRELKHPVSKRNEPRSFCLVGSRVTHNIS